MFILLFTCTSGKYLNTTCISSVIRVQVTFFLTFFFISMMEYKYWLFETNDKMFSFHTAGKKTLFWLYIMLKRKKDNKKEEEGEGRKEEEEEEEEETVMEKFT